MALRYADVGTDGVVATAFQEKVATHAKYYEAVADQLRLTDFNPLTVDWTSPVAWGNNPETCKADDMSDSSGCMMPLAAGLCARPPPRQLRAYHPAPTTCPA